MQTILKSLDLFKEIGQYNIAVLNKKLLKTMITIVFVTLFFGDRQYLKSQDQFFYNSVTRYSSPLLFVLAENLAHDPTFADDKRLGSLIDHNNEDITVLIDFLQRYQKGEIVKDYLDKQAFLVTDMYLRQMRRSGMRFKEFRVSNHVKKEFDLSTYEVRIFCKTQNYIASIVLSNDINHRDRKILAVNFEQEKVI